ncbi:MAG: outer spore coat protein CotE [Bacilli bacterium]|nr:outer spore coat protein CotE [Bacilli bacterium]
MASYKEIVTKTVIGKAKKTSKNNIVINPEQMPSTVLGCWVINHAFKGLSDKGLVKINGSFDVNVWYSYDSDHKTAVTSKTFNYTDSMNVPIKSESEFNDESEIIVRSLKQPTVSDVKINGNEVSLVVEKEMGVEIVGEGKIKVTIEEDEDDYEEIYDDDKIDEVVEQIDTEYLD